MTPDRTPRAVQSEAPLVITIAGPALTAVLVEQALLAAPVVRITMRLARAAVVVGQAFHALARAYQASRSGFRRAGGIGRAFDARAS